MFHTPIPLVHGPLMAAIVARAKTTGAAVYAEGSVPENAPNELYTVSAPIVRYRPNSTSTLADCTVVVACRTRAVIGQGSPGRAFTLYSELIQAFESSYLTVDGYSLIVRAPEAADVLVYESGDPPAYVHHDLAATLRFTAS